MRNLLICAPTSHPVGGIATWIDILEANLPAHGWSVTVALSWGIKRHDPHAYLRQHPARSFLLLDGRTGTEGGRRLAVQGAIRRALPDVVIPVNLADALVVAAAVKRHHPRFRLVWTSHELSVRLLADLRAVVSAIDHAVGVSPLVTSVLKAADLPPSRLSFIPYGVRPASVPRVPRAPSEALRLGYVGRLDAAKRPLDLVELAGHLRAAGVPFRLRIVGAGELLPVVTRALEGMVTAGLVVIEPACSVRELYERVYPDLDCVLLFSENAEGLPIVPLEAMANGVVPVVSDFKGRASGAVLKDGVTAAVFAVGDMSQAAAHLERLWRQPAVWERLSAAGRQRVREDLTIESMVARWAAMLDQVMAQDPTAECPASPISPSGRLDAFLNPRAAEAIRRLAQRRFPHPDASEWPFAGSPSASDLALLEAAVATAQLSLDRAAELAAGGR